MDPTTIAVAIIIVLVLVGVLSHWKAGPMNLANICEPDRCAIKAWQAARHCAGF
jgi:hypothetical protein